MPRVRLRFCWFSASALSAVMWFVPQAGRTEDAPVVSVPAAESATPEASESKLAPTEETPLTVAFREHLAAPQSGPCGRPDCPICNPKPAAAAKPPAPILPWKGLYFDNDFSYKGKPNAPHFLGEELKNIPLFDDCCEPSGITLSYGGEIRHRYMNEDMRLRPLAAGQVIGRSTYDLYRWRQYVDLKYRDQFRVYIEGIDASIYNNELAVTGIDKNRWDIQNAFFDLKVAERDGKPVYFRAGRQELLYGTPSGASPGQQVISPLDWANTRRNFEGFKLFSKGDTWDVDMFAVRPVNTANPTGATGGRPAAGAGAAVLKYDNQFDEADYSRWYSGIYSNYKGIKDHTFEPYYVWLQTDSSKHVGPTTPGGPSWADGNRHTLGLRWTMTKPIKDECDQPWLVFASDTEGAYQFGEDNDADVRAGFFTTKLATTFSQVPWTPQFTFIYYWGSGDTNPNDGKNTTYDVLVPLNHAYWGIIDNLAGQNLNDIAVQATIKPHKKLTGLAALHWFNLANNSDTVYNVAGAPVGVQGTGKDVGQELDLIATYVHNPNFDVQLGYSWFWYGSHFSGPNADLTPGPGGKLLEDATQLYIQTSLRY
ncbi:MAG: alginate export family protein [Planctomycetaceae bacterium]|nr:alginate export family protein [Planctomycetaceae bacterium]